MNLINCFVPHSVTILDNKLSSAFLNKFSITVFFYFKNEQWGCANKGRKKRAGMQHHFLIICTYHLCFLAFLFSLRKLTCSKCYVCRRINLEFINYWLMKKYHDNSKRWIKVLVLFTYKVNDKFYNINLVLEINAYYVFKAG